MNDSFLPPENEFSNKRIIHSINDLNKIKVTFENEVKNTLFQIDSIVGQWKKRDLFEDENDPEELFNKEERALKEAFETFKESLEQSQVDSFLSESKKKPLSEKLKEMRATIEDYPKILEKKLIKRRAILLTNWYLHQIQELKKSLKQGNVSILETIFESSRIKKNIQLFRKTIDLIDKVMVNLEGLKDSTLYRAMTAKGKLLTIKEDLILIFTRYKQLLVDEYSHYLFIHPEEPKPTFFKKHFFPSKTKEQKVASLKETRKKILSKLGSHHLTHWSEISFALSIPEGILFTKKSLQTRISHRRLAKRNAESKNIEQIAQSLVNEGIVIRSQASLFLKELLQNNKEMMHFGELLKQGTHLADTGNHLKAKINAHQLELAKKLKALKFELFKQLQTPPLDFFAMATNCTEIIKSVLSGSFFSSFKSPLYQVGIGEGVVPNNPFQQKLLSNFTETQNQLKSLNEKITIIELLQNTNKEPLIEKFCQMEHSFILQERKRLKIVYRKQLLRYVNNLFLTLDGLLQHHDSLSKAHLPYLENSFFATEECLYPKPNLQILFNLHGNWEPIGIYLKLNKKDQKKFMKDPKPYLTRHFNHA